MRKILAVLGLVCGLLAMTQPGAQAATHTSPPRDWYTLAKAAGFPDQQIQAWASTDAWRTVPVRQSNQQGRQRVTMATPDWYYKYYHSTDPCWQLWDQANAEDYWGDVAFYIKTTFIYCDNSYHVITYYDDNPNTVEKVYSWAAASGWNFDHWSNAPEDYVDHAFYSYFPGYPYSGLKVWRTGVFSDVYSGKTVDKRNWTHQYAHSDDTCHQSGGSDY